jgi:hypothetical protein
MQLRVECTKPWIWLFWDYPINQNDLTVRMYNFRFSVIVNWEWALVFFTYLWIVKVKVKFALEQATKAQWRIDL